jgi:hypothetical protein
MHADVAFASGFTNGISRRAAGASNLNAHMRRRTQAVNIGAANAGAVWPPRHNKR